MINDNFDADADAAAAADDAAGDDDNDVAADDDDVDDDNADDDADDAGMAPVATGSLTMAKTVTVAPRYLVLCN